MHHLSVQRMHLQGGSTASCRIKGFKLLAHMCRLNLFVNKEHINIHDRYLRQSIFSFFQNMLSLKHFLEAVKFFHKSVFVNILLQFQQHLHK